MKKLLILLTVLPFIGWSQNYEIANWFQFKKGAVCLTFDDGTEDHPTNAIPALNEKNLPGTFYLNKMGNYTWAIQAIAQGHEMGNHTLSHLHLPLIDTSLLTTEIPEFQITLESALGEKVNTLAYPFGEGGETDSSMHYIQDSVANTHVGARSVTQPINDSAYHYDFYDNDRAYYQVNTIHMRNDMKGYDSTFQKVKHYGGLMSYMFHAVGRPGGWDNIGIPEFNAFLDTLKNYESDIWVATLEDALMYHREKKQASLVTSSAPFADGNNWVLQLNDGLDDQIYTQALSIKLVIPSPITGIIAAYQDSIAIPFQVIGDTILFEAKPDGSDILFDVVDCVQPNDSITVTGPKVFCTPDSVIIEAVYNPNYVYSWYKDHITFEKDTNKISVTEGGAFHCLISLNNCPNYTDTVSITVTGICGIPKADFSANILREFMEEEISFSSTSLNLAGGESYFWDFGEGASLSPGIYGPGPVLVSYSTPGFKTVSLVANGSVGSDTLSKSGYIEIVPEDGCGIYKEDFNGDFNWNFVGCWCDYSADIVNDAFRITTRDTVADEWYWVGWWFNKANQDSTSLTPLDFSDPLFNPVLKIRAKASDTARVSFSLVDTSDTHTAGITMNKIGYIDLTTEYQTFELNFSDLFFYEWDDPVSPVDSSQIAYLSMSINSGWKSFPFTNKFGQRVNKKFVGHVDVDWISFGEKCETDSLIANIVLPDTVCAQQDFNVWNHSNPTLEDAQFKWSFSNTGTSLDTITADELPLTISYPDSGLKVITLEVTTTEGRSFTVVEKVYVKKCEVGISESAVQLTASFMNPFKSAIRGTVNSLRAQTGSMVLTDINGKIVMHEHVMLRAGSNELRYDHLSLPSGMYLLTIFTNYDKQQVKLVCTGK